MNPYRHFIGEIESALKAMQAAGELPADWATAARAGVPGTVARDYIAGMTDRFALAEYTRVFHTEIQL